jgi:hypothetical protein
MRFIKDEDGISRLAGLMQIFIILLVCHVQAYELSFMESAQDHQIDVHKAEIGQASRDSPAVSVECTDCHSEEELCINNERLRYG